jgi:hypothetical protein
MRYFLFFGLIFFLNFALVAQTNIYGIVTEEETEKPAAYVQIVIYRYKTQEVVVFTNTDEQGKYTLVLNDKNVKAFTLKTMNMTYENIEKDLFLDTYKADSKFEINLKLRVKTQTLDAAVVSAKLPPMIVKKDTIIYNISHWQDNFDQSLESVLAKIPGFEILSNGELKVNGKNVDKVLIDGEEITDGGAALLTRNLSPDKIKAIEVRMKEKNEKLKESLLSSKDMVVLDIKLKDDFNRALFGRLHATVGHQNNMNVGGNARLFTLNEKAKFQVMLEKDDFGDKAFSLSQVQNIGEEAFNKIFEIPADVNRLKQNPEFNKEVYGFREYVGNNVKDIALTGKITISPKAELFIGSYNSLENVNVQRNFNQTLLLDTSFKFSANDLQKYGTGFSKNKAELVMDWENTKIKYNFNAIIGNNQNSQNQKIQPNLFYDLDDKSKSLEFYHNLFLERRFSERSGLHFDLLMSDTRRNNDKLLTHNNENYALFWDSTMLNLSTQRLNQAIETRQRRWMAKLYFQTLWKGQTFQVGLRYLNDVLSGEKQLSLNNDDLSPPKTLFKTPPQYFSINQLLPYIEHSFAYSGFRFNNKIGLSNNYFSDFNTLNRQTKNILEWNSSIDYAISEGNDLNFSYKQSTASFPLYQQLSGSEIVDFQTVAVPGRYTLTPQKEQVVSFSATIMALSDYGIALEFAGIGGKAFNNASFGVSNNVVFESYYDQLPSNYYVLLNKIGKVFDKLPIQMKLESSLISYQNFNRSRNQDFNTVSTNIKNIDFRAFSSFKDKSYNFELGLKYTNFSFANNGEIASRNQDMWNVTFKYKQALFEQKLLFTASSRFTSFTNGTKSELMMFDTDISYVFKKVRIFLQVQNIFNSKEFIVQEITPNFYSDARRSIFGRYLKFGVSWDIN